jgi:colicin import membrane protein
MSAQYPGAYGLSALLHGAVVALVLFFSYASRSLVQDSPKVFELVAGAGDNYAARAAPALGSAGGVKLQAAPVPKAEPPPKPKAEASPIRPAPEAVPVPAKPAKPVDLVASLKKVEERRERKLELKYKKEHEAELKKEEAAAKADRVAHIDAEGIREGVLGGSTENKTGGAGGKALTREEGSELEAWGSLIKQRISENQAPVEGVSNSLVAVVGFFVSSEGSLIHVRIIKSSGNTEFDESVLSACERTHSIPPRPDGRSEELELSFHVHEDASQ